MAEGKGDDDDDDDDEYLLCTKKYLFMLCTQIQMWAGVAQSV